MRCLGAARSTAPSRRLAQLHLLEERRSRERDHRAPAHPAAEARAREIVRSFPRRWLGVFPWPLSRLTSLIRLLWRLRELLGQNLRLGIVLAEAVREVPERGDPSKGRRWGRSACLAGGALRFVAASGVSGRSVIRGPAREARDFDCTAAMRLSSVMRSSAD